MAGLEELSSLASGQPHDAVTRALMKPRFGRGLNRVSTAPAVGNDTIPDPVSPEEAPGVTELFISHPEDPSEREADQVARAVMAARPDESFPVKDDEQANVARTLNSGPGPTIRRKRAGNEEDARAARVRCGPKDDHAGKVQRRPEASSPPHLTPHAAANVRAMASGGAALPLATRAFFEPRFGADFSQVRVHSDAQAGDAARSINAKAFTVGQHIAFGNGHYAPESHEGRELLAHELTHVVQQCGNGTERVLETRPVSRAAESIQRDLLDDFTDELAGLGGAVVEGARAVGSGFERGMEAAGSAVTSVKEGVDEAVSSGAQAVASAFESGATTIGEAVDGAKRRAGEIVDVATEITETALDTILDWRHVRVNWDSGPGRLVRGWAARLDPEIGGKVRGISPSALLGIVSVPDEIQQAARELGKSATLEFKPGLLPTLDPFIKPAPPGVTPTVRPPPLILVVVIIIILAILLTPTNIFDKKGFEDEELAKGRKEEAERKAAEQKKKNETEKGRCRQTIPASRAQIHNKTFQELDRNADDFINERFKGERTADDLGFFFNQESFNFFLSITGRTKNTVLKVCSVADDTLGTSSGDKHIRDRLHAEELAAPLLILQLQGMPLPERAGATLFNVCQSRACVKEVLTNPDGCTAVLEGIKDQFLPGGQVVDEPTGFPPGALLIPASAAALLRQLSRRLPG